MCTSAILSSTCEILVSIDQSGSIWTRCIVWEVCQYNLEFQSIGIMGYDTAKHLAQQYRQVLVLLLLLSELKQHGWWITLEADWAPRVALT